MKIQRLRKNLWPLVTLVLLLALMVSPAGATPPSQGGAGPGAVEIKFDSKGNPVTVLTAETFANPLTIDWPWVRWNPPAATMEIPKLLAQLEELYAAGVGGVEIGQGGAPTLEQLEAILTKANELGMKVSLKSYAGGWGAPAGYSLTEDYVRKTLNFSKIVVDAGATFSGTLPGTGTIVAVLAYRCSVSPCPATGIVVLERDSVQDLTATITDTNTDGFFGGTTAGSITWTAPAEPAGAQWVLLTIRTVGVVAQPEVFSREGLEQLIAGYEAYWTPEIKELLKANGGDIFTDSHSADPFGAPNDLWSSNMAQEFLARKGYDLIPNLAALFGTNFTFSDGSAREILSDFFQVRSDLFVENRVTPFTEWAHTYNLTLRLQANDGAWAPTLARSSEDQIQVANALDRPEHETLSSVDAIDLYRPMASANHMNGNTWYSNELAAASGMNYIQTLQDMIVRMSKGYIGGQTKPVYHVYDYPDSPTATWPGHSRFGKTSFSNSWGPRDPNWFSDARAFNMWMARHEQVLKQGIARVDLAVYMQHYTQGGPTGSILGYWNDPALQRAGYTWDYLNPTLLNLPNAKVTNHRLAEDGPGYKALIYSSRLWPGPDINVAQGTLTLEAAKKFLEFARNGLPIIIVGEPPSRTPGLGNDAALQELVSKLLAEKTVYQVATEADVPALLQSLGILPSVRPETPSSLLSVHRYDKDTKTHYYFLYNQGHQPNVYNNVYEEPGACRGTAASRCNGIGNPIDLMVTLEGKGDPYLLDAASGKITPIVNYTSDGKSVTLRVKLGRDESMLIAISNQPNRFDVKPAKVHVEYTTADTAVQTADGKVAIRASAPGTYTTMLSKANLVVQTTVDSVPAPIDLTSATWHLVAEDWQPTYPYGTTGENGALTTKHLVELELTGLKPWPDIPELENASGIGTYSTVVMLPESWDDSYGAYLDLGMVVDSFTLTVNGHEVPVNQVSAKADIGPYLRAGENEITVRVSTTLNNRLAFLDTAVKNRGIIQNYGLVGPVVLKPYRQLIVWSK